MRLQPHIKTESGWVVIPVPEPVTSGTAFHYTGPSGLIGIVSQSQVWASSVLAMNDFSEIAHGLRVIHEAASARNDEASKAVLGLLDSDKFLALRDLAYVFSASTESDSLNQWVSYAGDQGYAIGFDMAGDIRPKRGGEGPEQKDLGNVPEELPLRLAFGWYRVVYDRDEQFALVNRLLDFCVEHSILSNKVHQETTALMIFGNLAPQFKHSAFSAEQEVRYICCRTPGVNEHYRPGRYGVVPYVELVAKDADTEALWTSRGGQLLPISHLVVGPCNSDVRESMVGISRRFMDSAGYSQSAVEPSSAPYRY